MKKKGRDKSTLVKTIKSSGPASTEWISTNGLVSTVRALAHRSPLWDFIALHSVMRVKINSPSVLKGYRVRGTRPLAVAEESVHRHALAQANRKQSSHRCCECITV